MFDLLAADLDRRMLDCPGVRVVACDPIHAHAADEIATRVDEAYP